MPSSAAVHQGPPAGPGSATRPGCATRPDATARPGFAARHPAWPVAALLVGYPLWWALGLGNFMWIILAVPMISHMVACQTRGDRRMRGPPRVGNLLLFLILPAAGLAAVSPSGP